MNVWDLCISYAMQLRICTSAEATWSRSDSSRGSSLRVNRAGWNFNSSARNVRREHRRIYELNSGACFKAGRAPQREAISVLRTDLCPRSEEAGHSFGSLFLPLIVVSSPQRLASRAWLLVFPGLHGMLKHREILSAESGCDCPAKPRETNSALQASNAVS